MKNAQAQVDAFMTLAGQEIKSHPTVPSLEVQSLRIKLHREEAVEELDEAFCSCDIVAIADSLADSLVVILGTASACGIDIEPIFNEVMRSNMTKFIGGYRREDGKWIKGPSYEPANIEPLLQQQINPTRCHRVNGQLRCILNEGHSGPCND